MIMLDALYNQLIKATIKQNHLLEEQSHMQYHNYDKLYRKTEIPLDERILTIRWVKIPTFHKPENKQNYYAIFLVDTLFWRKGELKQLYKQIIECIDSVDVDSFTIYLCGRLEGFFDKMDNRPRYYHIFRVNTSEFTVEDRNLIVRSFINYLTKRVQRAEYSMVNSVVIRNDIQRLRVFLDTFRVFEYQYCYEQKRVVV